MNKRKSKFTIFCLTLALSAPLCLAKDSSQTQQKTTHHDTTAATQKDCRLSILNKADIKSSAGEKLGNVADFTINPTSGKIDLVILGTGGFLNIGEKYVAVPWDKVSSTSQDELTLSVNKAKIEAAPKLNKDFSDLKDQTFLSSVYSYFGESHNVGAAESPGGKLSGGRQNSPGMGKTK